MRLITVIFCLSPAIYAQNTELLSNGIPPELRSYFALTENQLRQIASLNQDCQFIIDTKEALIDQLRQQIAIETEKPVLDAAVIGPLYAALEQALKDERTAKIVTAQAIGNLLTPSQHDKLKALQDAFILQPLIDTALKENFLTAAPITAASPSRVAIPRRPPEHLPSGLKRRN